MGLNAKKVAGGNTFKPQEPIAVGGYPARLVQVLDLGVQKQRPWKGESKLPCQEIMLTYELVDEFMKEEESGEDILDKPRWISETIPFRNLSVELATSTKRYIALDPDGVFEGDFTALVGTACDVLVTQNEGKGVNAGRVYNNIGGINTMRAKDAKRCEPLVNPPKVFILDEPDMEIFGSLPDWLQEKVKGNLEYAGSKLEENLEGSTNSSETDDEDDWDEDGE